MDNNTTLPIFPATVFSQPTTKQQRHTHTHTPCYVTDNLRYTLRNAMLCVVYYSSYLIVFITDFCIFRLNCYWFAPDGICFMKNEMLSQDALPRWFNMLEPFDMF
jgi:hypothetical protein